jgi:hypothetical protein
MDEKVKYTVARQSVAAKDCQCSCQLPVTVYFSSGKEAAGQKTFSAKEEAVQIKVLEVS